jgi:uncharacterized DUF497 family protein
LHQRSVAGRPPARYVGSVSTVVEGDFEWDAAKARSNLVKHGVSFEEATTVFDDARALEAPDRYDAERFVLIGRSMLTRILFVVHCQRGSRVRIISARKATPVQRRKYEAES